MVKWHRVGQWRLQTVLTLVPILRLESSLAYLRAIFRPERRICCPGRCWYIVAFLSGVPSISDIEKENAPPSLLLIHTHTDLFAQRWFGRDTCSVLLYLSGTAPAHSLLSIIIDYTAVECACLKGPRLPFSPVCLLSRAGLCWCLVGIVRC